jgi:hypothetical protein
VDWVRVTQDRVKCRAFVNMVMKSNICEMWGISLPAERLTTNFSRRTMSMGFVSVFNMISEINFFLS